MMIVVEKKKTLSLITALLLFIISAGVAASDDNLSIGAGSDGSGKAKGTSYSYVRDGDMNTYWSPTGSTGRVSIKWSSHTTVGTVVIKEAEGFEGNIGSWNLVNHDTGEVLGSGSGAGTIIINAVSLKKIDFVITSSSGTPGVAEFETYSEATTEADTPSDVETIDEDSEVPDTLADEEINLVNLSIGAGSDGSGKAKGTSYSYVRDGDMSTYWSPTGSTGRVSIKWSSYTTVGTVVIKEAEGFEGNIGSWNLVNHDTGEVLGSGTGAGTIIIDAVSLKKIDFVITSSSGTPGVAEFETYGEATTEPETPSDEDPEAADTPADNETILVTGITINADDITDGSQQQLETTVTPSNASNQTLTWRVDDESIAAISSTGLLTPVSDGQVTVTAVATDGSEVYDSAVIDISGVAAGTVVSSGEELLWAIESAAAGSTIYIRGGTYYFDSTITLERDGSNSKKITLSKHPADEERPLFDFSEMSENSKNRGIELKGDHWHIYGIDVKRAGDNCLFISGSNNVVEFSTFSECADTGVQLGKGAGNNLIKNVDSYYNADATLENADGFAAKLDVGDDNKFYGCRAWNNLDDGFDGYLRGADNITTTYENTWAIRNGYLKNGSLGDGDGNGFKTGGSDGKDLKHNAVFINTIAAGNAVDGYDHNSNRGEVSIYNAIAHNNGRNINFSSTNKAAKLTVKNTISMGASDSLKASATDIAFNSWQNELYATEEDFVSVEIDELLAPRKEDGSLPDVDYFKLVKGSDLIDAGVDVGLPYNGSSPDLGAFESE